MYVYTFVWVLSQVHTMKISTCHLLQSLYKNNDLGLSKICQESVAIVNLKCLVEDHPDWIKTGPDGLAVS
jgi:hypothetical protein